MKNTVLIDAREFVLGPQTGIGRFLEGLTTALAFSEVVQKIVLAVYDVNLIPFQLKSRENITAKEIPYSFMKSEKVLSGLTRQQLGLFISPYPKLPLFGCYCKCIHTIHDVLDLTHPAYRRRLKVIFDGFRLKKSLRKATLTWYVSSCSLKETLRISGFAGRNPRVRHNGIDDAFSQNKAESDSLVLQKYGLNPGYILVVGNGMPHKNLGVILSVSNRLKRTTVLVGVSNRYQKHWTDLYPKIRPIWINKVSEEDLPAIMRGSFCLAQPSTAEGFGYPPLEAMSCGIPAVVSDIPVLKETTGGNALTVRPNDPEAWLAAFEKLENDKIYKDLVKTGLIWIEPLRGRKAWRKHIMDIKELMAESI